MLGQFWAAAATERSARGARLNFEAAPERRVELRPEGYALVGNDLASVDGAAHRSFHLARQGLAREGAARVVEAHEVRGG